MLDLRDTHSDTHSHFNIKTVLVHTHFELEPNQKQLSGVELSGLVLYITEISRKLRKVNSKL